MFLENKAVKIPDKDIAKVHTSNRFLRPSHESANVANTSPPKTQPMRKDEAGNPVINELAHCKPHSDTIVESIGASQAQAAPSGTAHISSPHAPVVQCQDGWASVKIEMKVCWASNAQAKETKTH